MTDPAGVRASLHRALDKIGHRNSHACPPAGANTDPLMHELFIAHESWSHFAKRRQVATKMVLDTATTSLDDVEPGTERAVLEGTHYSLVVKKNNPAERIDKVKIGTALRKRGFDEHAVLIFMEEITNTTKAATSVRAVPKV